MINSNRTRPQQDNTTTKVRLPQQNNRKIIDILAQKTAVGSPKNNESLPNDPKSRIVSLFKVRKNHKLNLSADDIDLHSESTMSQLEQKTNQKQSNSKFPPIKQTKDILVARKYYIQPLARSLQNHSSIYNLRLFREHFEQVTRGIQITRHIRIDDPKKLPALPKTSQFKKTIILDLDQTLIHCNQFLAQSTVKLPIPIDNGMTVTAGVNVRPMCKEFLKELSSIAEVMIFTASNQMYADTVINYLDPERKYISHRMYRQHCTQEKGFFLKDLRGINRKLEDMLLVDNSVFSFCLNTDNGVPILPFYDNKKDRELVALLAYLREVVQHEDVRVANRQYFMLDKLRDAPDPRVALLKAVA